MIVRDSDSGYDYIVPNDYIEEREEIEYWLMSQSDASDWIKKDPLKRNLEIKDITRETKKYSKFIKEANVLNEEDFYPPPDDRLRESYIEDIEGGDTYEDYLNYFYDLYEDDLWD